MPMVRYGTGFRGPVPVRALPTSRFRSVMRRTAPLLLHGGIALLVLGLSKFHAASIAERPYDFSTSPRAVWACVFALLLSGAAYTGGLPDLTAGRARSTIMAGLGVFLGALAGISTLQLIVGSPLLPRFVVAGTALGLVPVVAVAGLAANQGRGRGNARERLLLLASEEDDRELASELAGSNGPPCEIVGVFRLDEAMPRMGMAAPVEAAAIEVGATVVVMDRESQSKQAIVDQVARLHEAGVRIRTLSLFYEEQLGKLPVAELERTSFFFDIGEVHRRRYARTKRIIDVALALALLPALAVSTAFVIVGNRICNRGPLVFRQQRVGKDGRQFEILKFRTMRADPTTSDTTWTAADDDRVTRFGGFLRRSHLDELPQMINILRGDLSLVGPRPEQPHYVELLEEKLPYYQLRHLVQPGLTGWAQVMYGYAGSERDALEKLQYEFYYLRHQSLRLDLRILARTARTVVARKGSR